MTRKLLITLFLVFVLLSGCNLPTPPPVPPVTEPPKTAIPPTETPTPTVTPEYRPCAFQWASQPLPDLTAQLAETLAQIKLDVTGARAEAYGENCIDENGQVVYFATMQTDFHITFTVASLEDEAELARLLEATLAVLDGFPPDKTPGPQPGYIGLAFEESSGEMLNLWFKVSRSDELRKQELNGVDLLNALKSP